MPVHYDLTDSVATITLDDGKANAIDLGVLGELHQSLDRLDGDGARAVVLAGRPGRFSAGFNLAAMTGSAETMRELVIAGGRFIGRLMLLPQPVVAACTGHALAMGGLLLLGADHRIGAAGDYKIGLNEVAIGMAMPRWGVELARYRIPPSQLEWHLVLGQTESPDQAVGAGFLDRVVAPEQVLDEARSVAGRLAGLRSGAVGGTKARLRQVVVDRMLDDPEGDLSAIVVETD
ncbi:MAG: crotonase/enoyl-CoA hydratase family protein [Actinomycetota bacterium]|nr:crotonase/enoyl-CoA hydratase family protein [Actinomycetota bacterium]